MPTHEDESWVDDDQAAEEDIYIVEYDISSNANDFNVLTMGSYIESGSIVLPVFQRHFVWDKARASKFIESLILGLPVPQIFLYEESKNRFLILDGQQRLMSIYYFMKGRFPKPSKRAELREIFIQHNRIPDETLHNDTYFQPFSLSLPKREDTIRSPFEGLNFQTLGDHKQNFELRPVRNIIIKQNEPREDNSSIYEIYDRLNTGGQNLKPQEIRANLYYSEFYKLIYELNKDPRWRRILGKPDEDIYMKDVELMLRSLAMLVWSGEYRPSMARFLNRFSNHAKQQFDDQMIGNLKIVFEKFLDSLQGLPENAFYNPQTRRFSIALFESAFVGRCERLFRNDVTAVLPPLAVAELTRLRQDVTFVTYLQEGTTKQRNVSGRLEIARNIL